MSRSTGDQAAYMAEWRKTPNGKESIRRQRLRREARMAAYKALERAFPKQFKLFFDYECKERGVSSSD